MPRNLQSLQKKAKEWLFDAAFPLWSQNGFDPRGGFREKLNLDGSVIENETTRVRVQARQIYCFSVAAKLGWGQGKEFSLSAIDNLNKFGFLPNGLPGMVIYPQKGLRDDNIDLYDVAFALFALSVSAQTFQRETDINKVNVLLVDIEEHLRHPENIGGYKETLPAPDLREQNPHMHLFEVLLAAYVATGNKTAINAAKSIEGFAKRAFFSPDSQGLLELFSDNPATDLSENRYEAGHQYEWVWLLNERARIENNPMPEMAKGFAQKGFQLTSPDGRIPLSHTLENEPLQNVFRTWSITEAIKAYLSLSKQGYDATLDKAFEAVELLFEDHLTSDGGWIDIINPDFTPVSTEMPASTFYHVVFALKELLEYER